MTRLLWKKFIPGMAGLSLSLAAFLTCGCSTVDVKGPSKEVKTFFMAGQQADALGALCLAPQGIDLSAYPQMVGVRYPPTVKVDILNEPPTHPYQAFAVLECASASGASSSELTAEFSHKAREIGADAIILCRAGPGQTLPPSGKIQVVAIKYKLGEK
ncbi:MAG: hypothetical protein M0P73_09285 [Syntrophobacterales bacterium]|jgi:hypothetical protein|nr:hypothetical protein [Syntrophobacterales bacterium]